MDDPMDVGRRKTARAEAQSINESLDYAPETDEAEATRRFMKYRSLDPFPDIPPALLNSADIASYVSATAMVHPFHPDRLKTASYEVALLGRWFYYDGNGNRHEGELKDGEEFILPHNSIVFMTVEPQFRIPDYIALRHNLKIDHIYKGLLVGTGPLIDPGFTGQIALPLHNLTMNDYTLIGGKGIIWVEFTKLSPNPAWQEVATPLVRKGAYTNFPAEKTWGQKVDGYVKDAIGLEPVPRSSNAAIEQDASAAVSTARGAEQNLRSLQFRGILAGTFAVIGIVATFITLLLTLDARVNDAEVKIAHLESSTVQPSPVQASPSPTPSSSSSSKP